MSSRNMDRLRSIAEQQRGLITTAQAARAGIARTVLGRWERDGTLERLRPGVYRVASSGGDGHDALRAAWLASSPARLGAERVLDPDVVIAGAAAASLHRMGDLFPTPYLMLTATRRQTRAADVRYRVSPVPRSDVMVVEDLPVTTRERTLADLLDVDGSDLSLVVDAFRDAELADDDLDADLLAAHLSRSARRLGHVSGEALYAHLRASSGVDEHRLRDLLRHTDLAAGLRVRAVTCARAGEGQGFSSTGGAEPEAIEAVLSTSQPPRRIPVHLSDGLLDAVLSTDPEAEEHSGS
jgi:predicted transcriptional regulator of viral defense system